MPFWSLFRQQFEKLKSKKSIRLDTYYFQAYTNNSDVFFHENDPLSMSNIGFEDRKKTKKKCIFFSANFMLKFDDHEYPSSRHFCRQFSKTQKYFEKIVENRCLFDCGVEWFSLYFASWKSFLGPRKARKDTRLSENNVTN